MGFVRLAVAALLVAGACSPGEPQYCKVRCGSAGDCPEGTACEIDGFCHSNDEPGELCSATGDDAAPGADAADPADAGLPALDEPCAETCAAELICANIGAGGSHCKEVCESPDDCTGPRSRCSRTDVESAAMICSSNCDPLGDGECSGDDKCNLSRAPDGRLDVHCVVHGGQAFGDSCEASIDCGPALLCIGVDPNKQCERLCEVGVTDCGPDATCTAVGGDNELGGANYSYCQPL
jgi:hypothetical protein